MIKKKFQTKNFTCCNFHQLAVYMTDLYFANMIRSCTSFSFGCVCTICIFLWQLHFESEISAMMLTFYVFYLILFLGNIICINSHSVASYLLLLRTAIAHVSVLSLAISTRLCCSVCDRLSSNKHVTMKHHKLAFSKND